MTDKEMIDEISENLMYCTHKDREVYPWDSSQRQMAKRVIELARLGEKYEQLLADVKALADNFKEDAEFCDDHDVDIVDAASAAKSLEWNVKAAVYLTAERFTREVVEKYG